ncbi:MAG: FkbM family methyltransferase [Mariniphaga sp.]|nr:FkbM family methyltransferase [Mariniphaga sp.]
MNILQSRIYRIIVPKFIRKKIVAKMLRASVLEYYAKLSEPLSDEVEKVLEYLRNRPVVMFPDYFQDEYVEDAVEVLDDKGLDLRYVMFDGRRLYFKKRWSKKRIRKSFNELIKEQDSRCPHCYEAKNFKVETGDVLADIGAAEGILALSVVEKASRIILFESNKEWLEPLNATFGPWKDKVVIVNKFVSDVTDAKCTTLDDYFGVDEKLSFLKIDVEGAEANLLNGCKRILQQCKPLKVAICTYHKPEDEHEFTRCLTEYGFETSHSDGFVLLFTDRKIKAPFLRRGLIRAIRH